MTPEEAYNLIVEAFPECRSHLKISHVTSQAHNNGSNLSYEITTSYVGTWNGGEKKHEIYSENANLTAAVIYFFRLWRSMNVSSKFIRS